MQHLEEGTIHAWLDGERPPDEARALEAHAASCAECAALVAEARGLMAASTRILGALDDVPAGVLPGQAEPSITALRSRPRRPRAWFRRPQFAAAAAVMLMAVGTWTVLRRTPEPAAALREVSAAPERMDSAALTSGAATPATVPPAADLPARRGPAPTPPGGANPRVVTTSPPAAPSVGRQEARAADAAAASSKAMALDQARDDSTRPSARSANAFASAQAQPRPANEVGSSSLARDRSERKVQAIAADSITTREQERLRGEVAAARPDTARRARPGDPTVRLEQAVVTGTGEASRRAGAEGDVIAIANSCYDLTRTASAIENGVPARVKLLDERGPAIGQRPLFRIRVVNDDPDTGEWFWWTPGDRGAMLVRVEHNEVKYEVPLGGRQGVDVRLVRRPCPVP